MKLDSSLARSSRFSFIFGVLLLASMLTAACQSDRESSQQETQPASAAVSGDRLDVRQHVGIEHPPIPEGLEERGGALAQAPGESAADTKYAFQHLRADSTHILWLSKMLGRNENGEPSWRVADARKLPPLRPDERLLIHGCSTENRTAIAAIVKEEDQEKLSQMRQAWGVDRSSDQLVELEDAGVTCKNEGLRAP